jgi:hypothetical protein
LRARRPQGEAARAAFEKKALEQMEYAARLATNAKARFYALNDLARMAFEAGEMEKAGRYANELLESAAAYPGDWNSGNAIHQGNVVLGRLDLRAGAVGKAKEHLLAAGRTKGSPQLNSFGPNMALAKELLERQEQEVVLEYLELCGTFWKNDRGRLEQWRVSIRGGAIPEFGASLYY